MGSLTRFPLEKIVQDYHVAHLIETGYGHGHSCKAALIAGFKYVKSCEVYKPLFDKSQTEHNDNITVKFSNSIEFLQSPDVKETLEKERCVIFLDAHYPGADYGNESYKTKHWDQETRLPLLSEMRILHNQVSNSIVIIDDCRIYLKDIKFGDGVLPDYAEHAFSRKDEFLEILNKFSETHFINIHPEDTGYVVLWPKSFGETPIKPWIKPGDKNAKFYINRGVVGTTCMSLNRRLMDSRFTSRWFVGNGLDIGGGSDSIGIYKSLFPLIQNITLYDMPQGDAQYVENVQDSSFDFIHSAHCLEHMVNPSIALNNWIRVLKPKGYLIMTIPDEDLYEQKIWSSTFNSDHKHTFTIFKEKSWSPVSINIIDLLKEIKFNIEVVKIEQLNHSYLPGLPRIDQTRTPFAESGIEVIIKKI